MKDILIACVLVVLLIIFFTYVVYVAATSEGGAHTGDTCTQIIFINNVAFPITSCD